MCACTTLTEDEVVQEIQLRNLSSVKEVMNALKWSKPEGCSTCLGALNYYLGMIHPGFESKRESPIINELMNATLQSDGTYTIIPKIYGGVTNAEQLRKIADVVEKYNIPDVIVSSGQRVQLMGVNKQSLAKVWEELNRPLRPAGKKAIQPIEMHIDENNCQCDKHPSLYLSVRLEKQLECLTTPDTVKIGISPCMHNGEEVMTKDVGLIRMNRGWEIYVGGKSGLDVQKGELFYVAETNEEALEIIMAFIQYYRETAYYLECIWQWKERMGLIHIREVIFEPELRYQLMERLEQDVFQYKKILDRILR